MRRVSTGAWLLLLGVRSLVVCKEACQTIVQGVPSVSPARSRLSSARLHDDRGVAEAQAQALVMRREVGVDIFLKGSVSAFFLRAYARLETHACILSYTAVLAV